MSMYNDGKHIKKSLDSILKQTYPNKLIEIIIVDSASTDNSAEIVGDYTKSYENIFLYKLNRKESITVALNKGIEESSGSIIVRLDCHVEAPKNYISDCVTALKEGKADLISGLIYPVGNNNISKAISLCLSSHFGIGDARLYQYEKPVYSKRGYLGVYTKELITSMGGYDENLDGADDFDLFYRINKNGGKILVLPRIKLKYYCRENFSGLFRQYFKYGYTKVVAFKKYRKILSVKSIVPFFSFSILISLIVAGIFNKDYLIAGLLVLIIYMLSVITSGIIKSVRVNKKLIIYVIFTFLLLHFSHSLGFFYGLIFKWYKAKN